MFVKIDLFIPVSYYSSADTNYEISMPVSDEAGTALRQMLVAAKTSGNELKAIDVMKATEEKPELLPFCHACLERGYEMLIEDYLNDCEEWEETARAYFDDDVAFCVDDSECYDEEDEEAEDSDFDLNKYDYKEWILSNCHTQEFKAERLGLDLDECFNDAVNFEVLSIEDMVAKSKYQKPKHAWKIEDYFERVKGMIIDDEQ